MRCEEVFVEKYGREYDGVAFCPYRVCPLGAHSDHQFGKITGFALDKGIHIAYGAKRNGIIELTSLQFDKRAQWHVSSVPESREFDWADYLRGATIMLGRRYTLHTGLSGVIEGSLPIGGLSSSAAVVIVFLSALCKVNGIKLTEREMIEIALEAENKYVGVSCGKLDQSCEVLCKKDSMLYLDTRDDSFEIIPQSPAIKPYKFAIFFSGVERNLAGSAFNMRVDECKSASYALKAFAGMEYGKYEDSRLRDVPREIFEQYKDRLPENWRLRAEHFYTELERVEKGAEAWRRGDLDTLGKLCFESGKSSVELYQTGSPELKTLYEIMTETDGIYGGRFSGAGFKGCCMAIIDPSFEESIVKNVTEKYLKVFPDLADKYTANICASADGVEL